MACNCACWHHNYIMLTSSLACLLCMMTSQLCHADIIIIRVSHIGRVNWFSGRVCTRGQSPRRRVRACTMFYFDAIFTSGFVSSSSTQWYGQNTILTTFIFEQKSNTTLNHMFWYQLLGIPAPLCADWWCTDSCPLEAKHTNAIFNIVRQIAYIHGRSQYY
jgi:hypothetical protein